MAVGPTKGGKCDVLLGKLGPGIHVDVTMTYITDLNIVADQVAYTPSWQQYSLMVLASFSRIMHPTAMQKLFRNGLTNMTKSSRHSLGLQMIQISNRLTICGMCWKNNIHEDPTSQLTGPTWSAGKVLGPDQMTPSEVFWSPCTNGSELFWWHKVDLHIIEHVVLML